MGTTVDVVEASGTLGGRVGGGGREDASVWGGANEFIEIAKQI